MFLSRLIHWLTGAMSRFVIHARILGKDRTNHTLNRLFGGHPGESLIQLMSEDWYFQADFRRHFTHATLPLDEKTVAFLSCPTLRHTNDQPPNLPPNLPPNQPRVIPLQISIFGENEGKIREKLSEPSVQASVTSALAPYLAQDNPVPMSEACINEALVAALDQIYFDLAHSQDPPDLLKLRKGYLALMQTLEGYFEAQVRPEDQEVTHIRTFKRCLKHKMSKTLDQIQNEEGQIVKDHMKRTFRLGVSGICVAVLMTLAAILASQPWKT